jgi:DNA-binding response OmpR family regulator/two-component sensor histidine kinase
MDTGHDIIKRNSDKIIGLTNQLLDLEKLREKSMSLQLVHDDVVLYTHYLVESFHSAASAKGIRLAFSSDPDEIHMDLDPDKFQEIVSNLLSNALKFTNEEGEVHVALSTQTKECGKQMKLEVRDTGVGIPWNEQHLIFNRYFQAGNHLDNGTPGSGLGLALTRELVHLMEGEISVQSAPGKGSVFSISLPIHDQAVPVSMSFTEAPGSSLAFTGVDSTKEAAPGPKDPNRLHLLLVEDNNDVLNYLSLLLEEDYIVHIAHNGVEGLESARHNIPDLIISDVMMPEMDGFTLTRRLKEDLRTSHIPVVLLTARSDADSRLEGLGSGADAYLAKPFNRQELLVRIENLIRLRRQMQQRYASIIPQEVLPVNIREGKPNREDVFMGRVRELLETHLDDEEFGITALCEHLAMSRSQLYRKFAALTDTTVNQYLQNLRLEKARQLLLTTDLHVSEVAYDTGFKNPSHFSRAFSNRYGNPPSQERSSASITG